MSKDLCALLLTLAVLIGWVTYHDYVKHQPVAQRSVLINKH